MDWTGRTELIPDQQRFRQMMWYKLLWGNVKALKRNTGCKGTQKLFPLMWPFRSWKHRGHGHFFCVNETNAPVRIWDTPAEAPWKGHWFVHLNDQWIKCDDLLENAHVYWKSSSPQAQRCSIILKQGLTCWLKYTVSRTVKVGFMQISFPCILHNFTSSLHSLWINTGIVGDTV